MYALRRFGSSALKPTRPMNGLPVASNFTSGTFWLKPIAQPNLPGWVTPAVCAVLRLYGAFKPMLAGMLLKMSSEPTRNPARMTGASSPNRLLAKIGGEGAPAPRAKVVVFQLPPTSLAGHQASAQRG